MSIERDKQLKAQAKMFEGALFGPHPSLNARTRRSRRVSLARFLNAYSKWLQEADAFSFNDDTSYSFETICALEELGR
jgi:hypothetical protein